MNSYKPDSIFADKIDEELKSLPQVGTIVNGIVTDYVESGAFVDLNGARGFLHIADMAWDRVRHPSEFVEVGQTVVVKILGHQVTDPELEKDKPLLCLGAKQLVEDQWPDIVQRYPKGTRLCREVTGVHAHSCTVEIENGFTGVLSATDIDPTGKYVEPSSVLKCGDLIEVIVVGVSEKMRVLILKMNDSHFTF
jgi:small subunit ribosomal protein S1